MSSSIRISLALALSLSGSTAHALDPARPLRRFAHDHWTSREGLPQNSILAAEQTPDGYLWFGTFEGIARFDGVTFKVFNQTTDPVLWRNGIFAMLTRKSGELLFTSPNIVGNISKAGRPAAFAEDRGSRLEELLTLAESPSGEIWTGAALGGLYLLRNGRFESVHPERFAKAGIRALAFDSSGALYIGTANQGVSVLRDGEPVACPACERLPKGGVNSLAAARGGGVWVGGELGLVRVDAARTSETVAEVRSTVTALRDTESGLWIGTLVGLSRWRNGRLETDPWLKAKVSRLMEDREGSLWVGTDTSGLYRLRDTPFSTLSPHDGLAEDWVSRLSYGDNAIWISTQGGVYKASLDDERVTYVETASPRDTSGFRSARGLVVKADGAMWATATDGRLLIYREGRFHDSLIPYPRSFASYLAPSRRGLFVGRHDGSIQEIVKRRLLRTIQLPPGVSPSSVHEWPDGRLTISTQGGLYEWNEGHLTDITSRLQTRLVVGTALVGDVSGALWLATDGRGLYRLKGEEVRNVSAKQGLYDDTVFQVVDDGLGYFWMTSNRGIARVSKAELNAVADGKLDRVSPRVFTEADGLRSAECDGGQVTRSPDGRLWFPTIAGVAFVDPSKVDLAPAPSLLKIEDARAEGASIAPGATLPAGVESVEIDYTSLSFRIPGRVRFRYQLEGYDPDFVAVQNRRTAYYPRLPYGSYRFVVHAVNEDGVSDTREASFAFSVAPRFHERRSAQVGFALLGLAGTFGLFRLRTNALRRRQLVLEALVADRTSALGLEKERAEAASRAKSRFVSSVSHELRTPLNAILGFADLLDRDLGGRKRAEYLALIKSSGSHLLGLVNSVLSLTKIEEGHGDAAREPFALASLVRDAVATLRPGAEANGLRLLEDTDALPAWAIGDGPKIRQILINLIGNAIKFTSDGYVALHVTRDGEVTAFTVEDTGPGIEEDQQSLLFREFSQTDTGAKSGDGTGLGLAISRRLAHLLGGDLSLSSSGPTGSKFVLTLALPESAAEEQAGRRRATGLTVRAEVAPVLIADDAAANRQLLRDLHDILGLTVLEAKDGPSALTLFLSARPSFVWTDALMPGFGGLELVRRIRQAERDRGWSRTPVVAVTASALGNEPEELLSAGCDSVILKPFNESQIFSVLEEKLGLTIAYEDATAVPATDGHSSTEARVGIEWTTGMDAEVARIEKAIEAGDWEQTRLLAHDLRGASSVLGLIEPSAAFAALEEMAFARDSKGAMRKLLTRARAAIDDARRSDR